MRIDSYGWLSWGEVRMITVQQLVLLAFLAIMAVLSPLWGDSEWCAGNGTGTMRVISHGDSSEAVAVVGVTSKSVGTVMVAVPYSTRILTGFTAAWVPIYRMPLSAPTAATKRVINPLVPTLTAPQAMNTSGIGK